MEKPVLADIKKDGLYKSKIYQCGISSLRAKVNSILCVKCGNWVDRRYAGLNRVNQDFYQFCVSNVVTGLTEDMLD